MSDEEEKIINTEELEKLGEVQKFQFDYFKLMATLNMAFITAIIALVKGVFEYPRIAFLSMLAFIFLIISLICSLIALVNVGNIILWMKGIPIYIKRGEINRAKKSGEKILETFDIFDIFQKITNYLFYLGVLALLIFTVWNFWSLF